MLGVRYFCSMGTKYSEIVMEERLFANRYKEVLPTLDEFQKRRLLASDAKILGRGGIKRISELSGVSRPTIYAGKKELEDGRFEYIAEIVPYDLSTHGRWSEATNDILHRLPRVIANYIEKNHKKR